MEVNFHAQKMLAALLLFVFRCPGVVHVENHDGY